MPTHLILGAALAATAAAGAGLAGYEVLKNHKIKAVASGKVKIPPKAALDPGMTDYQGSVVSKALQVETDSNVLDSLAAALKAAGYPNSANAVAVRSGIVKSALKSGAVGTVPAAASVTQTATTQATNLGTAIGKLFSSALSDSGSSKSSAATSAATSDFGVPHTNFMDAQSLGAQLGATADYGAGSGAAATNAAASSLFGTSGQFAVGTQVPNYGYAFPIDY